MLMLWETYIKGTRDNWKNSIVERVYAFLNRIKNRVLRRTLEEEEAEKEGEN